MGYFSVLLFLSATLAHVNADEVYGEAQAGTKELARRTIIMFTKNAVEFNTENQYELTVDKVEVLFPSGEATCKLLAGGPKSKEVELEITPVGADPFGYNKKKINATVVVYGTWAEGKEKPLGKSDIRFGPKSTILNMVLFVLQFL